MPNISITLLQSNIHWESITANLAALEEKIWKIKSGTDLIILPEMFNTGFSMNLKLAEAMNMATFKWMKQLAAQTGAVITGSYMVNEAGKYFNRLIWMQPDGVFFHYDKKHLFRNGEENLFFTKGNKKLITTWKEWKFCPLICYDLRFPIWSRNKWDNDVPLYDCLVYVANWPSARHIAWENLLKARAIENLSYSIGVNRIGKDEMGLEYLGGSAVTDFAGNTVFDARGNESYQTIIMEKEILTEYRKKYPFYLDADI